MNWLLTQDVAAMLGAFVNEEPGNLLSLEWYRQNIVALLNITMIDLVLAGDNAIIVGMAASRVAPEIRAKVIFWGITAAVVLRIFFAAITVQLLAIIGLTLAGGILLLWVCWKMYRQITIGRRSLGARRHRHARHRARLLVTPSASSPSPTSPCRSTTCWRSPVPPRARSLVLVSVSPSPSS